MTVEDVARDVLAAINSDANYLLACRWVAERYRELCSRTRLRHLRKVGQLHIAAPIHTGTVAVTRESSIVSVSDADALSALPVGEALKGRWFRGQRVWYRILDYTVAEDGLSAEIQLDTPYTEPTNANIAYRIVERFVALPKEVRWIAPYMVLMRRYTALEMMTQVEADVRDPSRLLINGYGPTMAIEIGTNEQNQRIFEFYPYSSQAETITFVYWSVPPELKENDEIPPAIEPHVLREGALIDAMRYEAAQMARTGNNEGAATMTNSWRSQKTAWERDIMEALRTDRGVDDLTFLMRSARQLYPGQIMTARDEVYARVTRP